MTGHKYIMSYFSSGLRATYMTVAVIIERRHRAPNEHKICITLTGNEMGKWVLRWSKSSPPCPIRSDHQTTSLTLTTGAPYSCRSGRGASNMNIHYDVTGLLTQGPFYQAEKIRDLNNSRDLCLPLRDYKKLVDFPRMSPSLTCIGRIRAFWPTRWILTILICKWAIYTSSYLFSLIKRGPGQIVWAAWIG